MLLILIIYHFSFIIIVILSLFTTSSISLTIFFFLLEGLKYTTLCRFNFLFWHLSLYNFGANSFVYGYDIGIQFHPFPNRNHFFSSYITRPPAPITWHAPSVMHQRSIYTWTCLGAPFHWSSCLYLSQLL